MGDNKSNREQSPAVVCRLFKEMFPEASPDHDLIEPICSSLGAISEKIDQAYIRICMDLPEINMEIDNTFRQASVTLDSLCSHGTKGKIESAVEGIECTLQDLALLMKGLKRRDEQALEAIRLTQWPLENALCMLEDCSIEQIPDYGMRESILKFASKRDDLVNAVKTALETENAFIKEISLNVQEDTRSLEYTLSSAVFILRDLVSRSNSVKGPILKIMSGLQAHDIVNQDITNISNGLQRIKSLRNSSGNQDDIMDALLFQEQASFLSRDLICHLVAVVRNHGADLCKEIARIEDTVVHVKEDKDAIGDFLLTNEDGRSTFDVVISEIAHMLSAHAEKIEALISIKESQQSLTDHLISLCADLDRHITSSISGDMPPEIFEPVSKMISLLISQAKMLNPGDRIHDIRGGFERFQKEIGNAKCSLEEIKNLLIGSIQGIDAYSSRCIDAIMKFRLDIDRLMTILNGSESIFDNLNAFARSLASIREAILHQTNIFRCEIFSKEFNDILLRLKNPHSNSLAEGDCRDLDEGLVLF